MEVSMRAAMLAAAIVASAPAALRAETVVVNEVMYRPWNQSTVGKYEFIELYNHGNEDVDLSGLILTDSQDWFNICEDDGDADSEGVFEIPEGTVIPAGSYLTFWHTHIPGVTDQPGNVVYSSFLYFGNLVLNDNGDQVALFACEAGVPAVIDALDYGVLGLTPALSNASIERIDPLGFTQDASNWGFTLADRGGPIFGGGYTPGGTPGAANTIAAP
jgi:hypothetical protein